MLRPLAAQKKVTLAAELADATVPGDPMRLNQVITNLLTNAVQYNRRGGAVPAEQEPLAECTPLQEQQRCAGRIQGASRR